MRAHALVHSLAQTWTQIGRNPAAALGNIAPNIGSVVAIEKDKERTPGQVFPTFLALNSRRRRRRRAIFPRVRAVQGDAGHRRASPTPRIPTGQTRFNNRCKLLHSLDDNLRVDAPNGTPMERLQRFLHVGHRA